MLKPVEFGSALRHESTVNASWLNTFAAQARGALVRSRAEDDRSGLTGAASPLQIR